MSPQIPTTRYVDREMIIADQRYRYICDVCSRAVHKGAEQGKETVSDKIDNWATHRVLAIPIFLALMLTIFYITFGPFGAFFRIKWMS